MTEEQKEMVIKEQKKEISKLKKELMLEKTHRGRKDSIKSGRG